MTQQHYAIQEVIDLHTFFEAWLGGVLPENDAEFARFVVATDPNFTLISPDGRIMGSDAVSTWIRSAHGTRPGFRLWTTNHHVVYAEHSCALVSYLEWQARDAVTTCRISSALFVANDTAPNGYAWRHVHETWLQGESESAQ